MCVCVRVCVCVCVCVCGMYVCTEKKKKRDVSMLVSQNKQQEKILHGHGINKGSHMHNETQQY